MLLCNRSVVLVPFIAGSFGLVMMPSLFGQEKIKIKKLDDLPRELVEG